MLSIDELIVLTSFPKWHMPTTLASVESRDARCLAVGDENPG
jgi:hypothetical protein